jgi:hypothetical protein
MGNIAFMPSLFQVTCQKLRGREIAYGRGGQRLFEVEGISHPGTGNAAGILI